MYPLPISLPHCPSPWPGQHCILLSVTQSATLAEVPGPYEVHFVISPSYVTTGSILSTPLMLRHVLMLKDSIPGKPYGEQGLVPCYENALVVQGIPAHRGFINPWSRADCCVVHQWTSNRTTATAATISDISQATRTRSQATRCVTNPPFDIPVA